MTEHAKLSASSAYRWLACPPSVALSEEYPDKASTYAQEGTDAHTLCQYKVEKALGREADDPVENLTYYNAEMENCAEGYADFVMDKVAAARKICKDAIVMVEQRLDFSKYVPGGFGTGDCVIVADGSLYIIDFKYGLGVIIEAVRNPQMMCYALGALQMFDELYDIKEIHMSIYQPRRQNVSTYTMTKNALLDWAKKTLMPTAKLAFEGKGEFQAGDHCRFCKAKAVCRKRAEYNLELARYDFAMPSTLEPREIAAILPKIDSLVAWGEDIKKYALDQALAGTNYEGYKVVQGRSTRKYTSESDVAKAVVAEGFNPYEKKLLGVTAMQAMLGRKRFNEILGKFIYKPEGKPTLVPETDPRPVMNSAATDFKEEK